MYLRQGAVATMTPAMVSLSHTARQVMVAVLPMERTVEPDRPQAALTVPAMVVQLREVVLVAREQTLFLLPPQQSQAQEAWVEMAAVVVVALVEVKLKTTSVTTHLLVLPSTAMLLHLAVAAMAVRVEQVPLAASSSTTVGPKKCPVEQFRAETRNSSLTAPDGSWWSKEV